MVQITFEGKPVHTNGHLPANQAKAPDFRLVDKDLKDHTLQEFRGKRKLLATVPSLDTGVCSTMTKHINDFAKKHPQTTILVISTDLPFAQSRFCEHAGVHNVLTLSMMRDKEFGKAYGILMLDGPLAGILARSILVLDEKDHVIYSELVPEITQEPNYKKAFEALQS